MLPVFISILSSWALAAPSSLKPIYTVTPGNNSIYLLKTTLDHGFENTVVMRRTQNEKELEGLSTPLNTRASIDPTEMRDDRVSPTETIWDAKNEWNEHYEKLYSNFVHENATTQFLRKHHIKIDCADLAFVLRWIFARIHYLPMASHSASLTQLITHRSVKEEWLTLPKHEDWSQDQRFRTALQFVLNSTFTHSLYEDLYPFRITQENIRPGIVSLEIRTHSGHTVVLKSKSTHIATDPGEAVYGNTPAREAVYTASATYLERYDNPADGGTFYYRTPKMNSDGNITLVKKEEMPDYSLEQYSEEFKKKSHGFHVFILSAEFYFGVAPDFAVYVEQAMKEVLRQIDDRVKIVNEGYRYCKKNDCSPNTQAYDDWSTPSRDARIMRGIDLVQTFAGWSYQTPQGKKTNQVLKRYYKTEIIEDEYDNVLTYYDYYDNSTWGNRISSDPRESISRRWALKYINNTGAFIIPRAKYVYTPEGLVLKQKVKL